MSSVFFDAVQDVGTPEGEEVVDDKLTLGGALAAQGYRLGSDPAFATETLVSEEEPEDVAEASVTVVEPVVESVPAEPTVQTSDFKYVTTPSTISPFFTAQDFLIFE